ncbi:NUDIX hydrolase [Oenococcus sp. UCMA 16435]|nr:NUDIX hydrolase [Oenococcus sp. UCMA 16435]MDI4584880.1 NUDIX domain-containing protein [Oenococcus sp. UCMA 14587]
MKNPTHIVAVGGVVLNENQEILLVKTFFRGWEIPGGQVENGENLIDALKREVKEESGIEVKVGKLIGIYSNIKRSDSIGSKQNIATKVIIDFICQKAAGKLSISSETSKSSWISKKKVLDLISYPIYQERFKNYLNFSGEIKYAAYFNEPNFSVQFRQTI